MYLTCFCVLFQSSITDSSGALTVLQAHWSIGETIGSQRRQGSVSSEHFLSLGELQKFTHHPTSQLDQ